MKQFITVLLSCMLCQSWAQTVIQGNLLNSDNQAINGASISLTPTDSDAILAYAISDKNGDFSISIESEEENFNITIRSMEYAMVSEIIENKDQKIQYYLTEQAIELKDVIAKARPIRQRGDTLDYSVNAFAQDHDRSIGDVLSRMPGIEVLSDGQVLYQGKPINRYYIDNLDMLEGRYNLANKNLSHKDVASVQVLENHQPIQILDSLVYSENAALNIKLKNDFTFSGQAELGAGAAPLLWEANITPMMFARNKQMLATYQTNNTGNNVANQFRNFSFESLSDPLRGDLSKNDWLRIQSLSTPNFSDKRWLDNNIHILSNNFLYKLKSDYQLKFNISYLNDYQQVKGLTQTQYFTANDTIHLYENKYNQLYFNNLEANLIVEKNTKKNFLKNTLNFHGFWDGQRGMISNNNENIHQELNNPYFKLNNTLTSVLPIGKQLMNLKSYIGIDKTPQELRIRPGQFSALLNQDEVFDFTTQELVQNEFLTNNSLGFTKGIKHFTFSPQVGIGFVKQNLNSSIFVDQNQLSESEFNNDLDWTQTKVYAQLSTEYRRKKWNLSLTTPLMFSAYDMADKTNFKAEKIRRLSFEPRLFISFEPSAFWKFNVGANYSENLGEIHDLHYAYLIKNYRTIQRIDAPLPQRNVTSFTTGFNYRNPIKTVFWNLYYSHAIMKTNLLYETNIQDNAATEIYAIEQENKGFSHNVSSRFSKYFSRMGTNLSLQGNFRLNTSEQIINDVFTEVESQNASLSAKIEKEISSKINLELNTNWSFFRNNLPTQSTPWITSQSHQFKLNLYPSKNQYIGLTSDWSINDVSQGQKDYFFTDILYRYTWKKANIDFEFQWNNIFNVQDFSTFHLGAYSYTETNFRLRPSQAMLKIRFSL